MSKLSNYREGNRLEAKKAAGGLPDSIWETYSAFANTNGGVILLGVEEKSDKSLNPIGLADPERLVKQFWDNLNNAQKINVNILKNDDVTIAKANAAKIVKIDIPRADRHARPIYIGTDPFKGSYRRNGEGDYRCHPDEVRNMFRDQSNNSMDQIALDYLTPNAFDYDTVNRYRNRLRADKPEHVWIEAPNQEFLLRLGALVEDENGKMRPTAAGLLMFGYEYYIVREFPQYFLDYQENDGTNERWTDRFISSSSDWSGNLYDFYYKALNRLTQDVKVPFKIGAGATRIDETPVHRALGEALANALVNTNYYERMGLVVKKWPGVITIANPGGFRIPLEKALAGGHSDPRNATLLKLFNMLGVGERSGSGIPKVFSVWRDENWGPPHFEEEFSPERTVLTLPLNKTPTESIEKNLGRNVGKNLGKNVGKKATKKQLAVLKIIQENPDTSTYAIAVALKISPQAAFGRIKTLKNKNIIRRIGPANGGYWEIISD